MKRPILIIGGAGQLGLSLQMLSNDSVVLHAPTRDKLNLMSETNIRDAIFSHQWSSVINVAAYTAVDKAESERDLAWHVNAIAPGILAHACAQRNIPLVHLSTDYVFSGDIDRAYVEDDLVGPINIYGESKEAGESAVRNSWEKHIIIRTSWVVSALRNNFLKTILRISNENNELRIVSDQIGRPTSAHDLASVLFSVTEKISTDAYDCFGTYHYANSGVTNWADFAREIVRINCSYGGPATTIKSIKTSDYPTSAKRPRNSVLSTKKIENKFGLEIRPWEEATFDIIAMLARKEIL